MGLVRGQPLKKETAVWWRREGLDATGEPVRSGPKEIDVRWQGRLSEVPDARGVVLGLDAIAIVLEKVKPGDLLWLGALRDWDESTRGDELMQVTSFADTMPLKNGLVRRTLGMKKFRATLPDQAGAGA